MQRFIRILKEKKSRARGIKEHKILIFTNSFGFDWQLMCFFKNFFKIFSFSSIKFFYRALEEDRCTVQLYYLYEYISLQELYKIKSPLNKKQEYRALPFFSQLAIVLKVKKKKKTERTRYFRLQFRRKKKKR